MDDSKDHRHDEPLVTLRLASSEGRWPTPIAGQPRVRDFTTDDWWPGRFYREYPPLFVGQVIRIIMKSQ